MEENKAIPDSAASQLLDVRQPVNTRDIIENIKSQVKEGRVNPLEAFTVLKRMHKVSEEVLKDQAIKEMSNNEFDKYIGELKGKKSLERYGAQICKTATYTFYDFSECKHEVLDELYRIQEEVKEKIKNIEEELKLIPDYSEKSGAIPGLGIPNTSVSKVFEQIPKLVWEDYGIIGQVERPRKVQTIGLKYMKL
jgi:hypothetical protein